MRKLLMAVAAALMPGMGAACTWLEPFDVTQIGGAELVMIAEVTGYQDLGTPQGAALVTVKVEEVLKGAAPGEVVLVWNSGMAQGPHESGAQGRVLIGAMRAGRLAVSTMIADERPDLPAIVQPLCGRTWMQPATTATVAVARKVLE